MNESIKKINQFLSGLKAAATFNSDVLNKIAQSNPSISEDIKSLNNAVSIIDCAPEIIAPDEGLAVQPLIAREIPGDIGDIQKQTVTFPTPLTTSGISGINIVSKNRNSSRFKALNSINERNRRRKNKLPARLVKQDLRDRKILDLFDKDFINSLEAYSKNRFLGKTTLSVNNELYSSDITNYLLNVEPTKNTNFLPDNFRSRIGSYWSLNEKRENLIFINQYDNYFTKKPLQLLFLTIENENSDSLFGRTKQSIGIRAKRNQFLFNKNKYSSLLYKKFIQGGTFSGNTLKKGKQLINFFPTIASNITFFDHAHEFIVPLNSKEAQLLAAPIKPLTINLTQNYNTYIKNYEDTILNNNLNELLIPNIYVFSSLLANESSNAEFKEYVTLGDLLVSNNKELQYSSEYFDNYSKNILNIDTDLNTKFENKFKNLVFSNNQFKLFDAINSNKQAFPMNIDIEFSTDNTTTFTQILKDCNLSTVFLLKMVENILENKLILNLFSESAETILEQNDNLNSNQKRRAIFRQKNKKYIQLDNLLKDVLENNTDISNKILYFGNYQEEYSKIMSDSNQFYKSLMNVVFSSKIQEFIKNNFRTYQEMIGGALAYTETLMYRIAKFEGNITSEQALLTQPLQNIYFLNSNNSDIVKFVDTQVKYNKEYTYVVYAYNLVLGNKYLYSELDNTLSDDVSTFSVFQEPSPIIMEEEYHISSKKVFDYPPVFPDLQFIPFKGIDNKLRININSNTGIYNTQPTIINISDKIIFDKATKNQERLVDEPIKFSSDDYAKQFEVYRTDVQPENYSDFSGKLIATVNTDVFPESSQSATAASFIDSIEPNKKYYYIARSIDVHGNISNPTEILEVEIINENGTIYFMKKPATFAEKKKQNFKDFRRFIEIKPNALQVAINEEKALLNDIKSAKDIKNNLILGKVDQSMWGKIFVMKIISKSTGKKIDIKFKFDYEQVKQE